MAQPTKKNTKHNGVTPLPLPFVLGKLARERMRHACVRVHGRALCNDEVPTPASCGVICELLSSLEEGFPNFVSIPLPPRNLAPRACMCRAHVTHVAPPKRHPRLCRGDTPHQAAAASLHQGACIASHGLVSCRIIDVLTKDTLFSPSRSTPDPIDSRHLFLLTLIIPVWCSVSVCRRGSAERQRSPSNGRRGTRRRRAQAGYNVDCHGLRHGREPLGAQGQVQSRQSPRQAAPAASLCAGHKLWRRQRRHASPRQRRQREHADHAAV